MELPPWALDDLLLFGVVGGAGAFVLQAVAGIEQARYLLVSTLFACILCARLAARAWPALSSRVRFSFAVVAGAVLLSCGAGFGLQLSRPIVKGTTAPLVSFLQDHHLTYGIGDYWDAAMTTVQSSGRVEVAPVDERRGKLVRMWNSPSDWYDRSFQFLVFHPPIWAHVDYASAVAAFGRPAHDYRFDGWSVLVWSRPIHVPLS